MFPSLRRPSRPRPTFRPQLEVLEAHTVPALLHVTSLADDSTAGTLRSIISTANTNADTSNTIVFDVTGTIDLTAAPLNPTSGASPGPTAFDVNKALTILGSGQTITRDAAAADFRFFFVEATGNLSLSNLTLSNGLAIGFYGTVSGDGAAGLGGAIYNRGTLSIQGVTFTGDAALGGAGGDGPSPFLGGGPGGSGGAADGGAIFSEMGPVTITNSTLSGNSAAGGPGGTSTKRLGNYGGGGGGSGVGGAVFVASGELTITNSTLSGNSAAGSPGNPGHFGGAFGGSGVGGAVNVASGELTITNSTLSGNSVAGGASSSGVGGAVNVASGVLTITNSTLSGNSVAGGASSSGVGGAVNVASGVLTITNSTLSGNSVASYNYSMGGAVNIASGELTITNSTLSGNSVAVAGGAGSYPYAVGRDVSIDGNGFPATAVINNSILGQTDSSVSDFYAFGNNVTSSGGNNLIRNPGDFGGSSSQADPMLDPAGLKDNGGLTQTIALLPGSPAIDAGDASLVPAGVTTDQRGAGFARISGGRVDIGAFEVQQAPPPSVSVAFGPAGEVVELVNSAGVLTQFDATGAHQLGNGGVRSASVAFGPSGEVLEIVSTAGVLTQFDSSGAHQLGGAGVESASVAFGPGGELLEVVLTDGSVRQFSAAGVQLLGTGGVVSASAAFGPSGLVVEILSTAGVLTQFDANGAHQLSAGGVQSAGVAFTSYGEVLDIIFADGTLDQFDAFGVHRLGMVP